MEFHWLFSSQVLIATIPSRQSHLWMLYRFYKESGDGRAITLIAPSVLSEWRSGCRKFPLLGPPCRRCATECWLRPMRHHHASSEGTAVNDRFWCSPFCSSSQR